MLRKEMKSWYFSDLKAPRVPEKKEEEPPAPPCEEISEESGVITASPKMVENVAKIYAEISALESDEEEPEDAGADVNDSEVCNYGASPMVPSKADNQTNI